ncbi:ATP-binding cassette domain-containing protein [Mycobacterium sp. PDNC021]|uniref:ATP-binding cassette domain-containing protein n=1 Tax=Mycobacterium sp. PDNC021 TaxID=3391399 RepID=UPI003AAD618D
MAHASVVAAASAGLAISAAVVPVTGFLAFVATVPVGLLAYRHRLRVLVTAATASATIAFLIIGVPGAVTVLSCAYIGGLAGIVKRRGGGIVAVAVAGVAAGAVLGAVTSGVLLVLAPLRVLVFSALDATMNGLAAALRAIPALRGLGDGLAHLTLAGFSVWPLLLTGWLAGIVTIVSIIGWWIMSGVLRRLGGIPDVHKFDPPPADLAGAVTAPLPVHMDDASFRYPGAQHNALAPTNLTVDVGERVAVVGCNGSGKSTLGRILAGAEPTAGTVRRPGGVGLGRIGGTAVVLQHPETQVLGMRVADDVVWGLPTDTPVDVDAILHRVGLAGMRERATDGLSGGELQRLAVAAALARSPKLLIADEITSMVDPEGRAALLAVVDGLTAHQQMSVVEITHYRDEAESADRVISLSETGDNTAVVPTVPAPASVPAAAGLPAVTRLPGLPVLRLDGVSHQYAAGTPWAHTTLCDINLTVYEGDGVLIHGGNGSGKSTLAWIMAGLTTPSVGSALFDGKPTAQQVGAVAVAFQAARLQLMRSRVDCEIASAAGFDVDDTDRVVAVVASVGLDAALARRRVDQLSGGQQRRLVLAGLLARKPRVLILDEPLAGLDAASARGLVQLLTDLRRDTGLTIIMISHDFLGLDQLCPRVLRLHNGVVQTPISPSTGASS